MKQNTSTSNRLRILLTLLSVSFATGVVKAQEPELPSPAPDIEKADPSRESAAETAAGPAREPSAEMLALAQHLFAIGEIEKARQLLQEAVEQEPESAGHAADVEKLAERLKAQAQVHVAGGDVEKAIQLLRERLKQESESPSPAADIEKSDPFRKSAADPATGPVRETSAEMLTAQAQVLFARGEVEKAIQLQQEAVEQAEMTLAKANENLGLYQGRPVNDGPMARKLRELVIPFIDFSDASLEEAVDFIRAQCERLEANVLDPSEKGVNIVVAPMQEPVVDPPATVLPKAGNQAPRIIKSLKLHNVPLGDALKYICQATGTRFEIDDHAVNIVSGTP